MTIQYTVGLGLAAIQWVPFLEMLRDSDRPLLLSSKIAFQYSQTFPELAKALFCPSTLYAALSAPGDMDPAVGSYFLGPTLALLFLVGSWRGDRRTRVASGIALMGFVMATGPALGFYESIPLSTIFRFPSHWLMVGVSAFLLVALVGWSSIPSKPLKWIVLAVALFDLKTYAAVPRVTWGDGRWIEQRLLNSYCLRTPPGTRLFHPSFIPQKLPRWSIKDFHDWDTMMGVAIPSVGASLGVREVQSFSVLTSSPSARFQERLNKVPFDHPLFDVANVGAAITLSSPETFKRLPSLSQFLFLTNHNPRGRAFLLEGGPIEILRDIPGRFECRVTGPDLLIFSESYHRGWKARIGKQKATPKPYEAAFLSVSVPDGVHTVAFRFLPGSFILGLLVSGTTAVGCCLWTSILWRGRKREMPEGHGTVGSAAPLAQPGNPG